MHTQTNQTTNVLRSNLLLLITGIVLLAAVGCGESLETESEPAEVSVPAGATSPGSDVTTLEVEAFAVADDEDQQVLCPSLPERQSLDRESIYEAREDAVEEAISAATRACGNRGVVVFPANFNEISYYESIERTCIGEGGHPLNAKAAVELYAATLTLQYACGAGDAADGGFDLADPTSTQTSIPQPPKPPFVAPEPVRPEQECSSETDIDCCSDVGCCVSRGGGEGYCDARYAPEPESPETMYGSVAERSLDAASTSTSGIAELQSMLSVTCNGGPCIGSR